MSVSSRNNRFELEEKSPSGFVLTLKRMVHEEIDDLKKATFWRAVVAEFIGSFFLVFLLVGAGLHDHGHVGHSSVHVILAAGFFFAVVISSLLTVSGGHVNPAVSIAFLVTREISIVRFLLYVIAQIGGGIAGAALLQALTPRTMHGDLGLLQPGINVSPQQALCVEVIITFFLLFVIFSLIDSGRKDVQGSIPLIIGLTVCLNAFFAGHISGGCMNPIRNFGPALMTGNFKNQWIYWTGPLIGGALGGLIYSKFFSVAAGVQGILACTVSKKPYGAVKTSGDNNDIEMFNSRALEKMQLSKADSMDRIDSE